VSRADERAAPMKAIIDLLVELAASQGMATVLITHDLALAGERCARLVVMKGGCVIETGSSSAILNNPREPYTRSLVTATPQTAGRIAVATSLFPSNFPGAPLLKVEGLTRLFRLRQLATPIRQAWTGIIHRNSAVEPDALHAVDDIDLHIAAGESVGLVGELGSGKSTLAGLIIRLIDPTAGRIYFRGTDIGAVPARRFAGNAYRRDIQMVFQDPSGSLNPRQTAFTAIAGPICRLGSLERGRPLAVVVHELAEMVGFPSALLKRLAHQLSGGEKARVGIARAIALRPCLLVLDEPTAALDVRVQAVVLDLLAELRRTFEMTYLFVSHDLAVVRRICDRVLVMQAGRIVGSGPTEELFTAPRHPYTRSLVAAIPRSLPNVEGAPAGRSTAN
jgi:peptide/nickel transport system ATP-binding protein